MTRSRRRWDLYSATRFCGDESIDRTGGDLRAVLRKVLECERCLSWKPQTGTRVQAPKEQRAERKPCGVFLSRARHSIMCGIMRRQQEGRGEKADGGTAGRERNSRRKRERESGRTRGSEERRKVTSEKEREKREREKDVIWLVHRVSTGKGWRKGRGPPSAAAIMHREKCARARTYVPVYAGSNGSKERHGALLVLMADSLHTRPNTPRRYRRVTSDSSARRKDDFIPDTTLDHES